MATDDKKIIKEQLRHMAERIQTEGKKIGEEPLIIDYDNGGGQTGTRENPFYHAYEKLLLCYTRTLVAAKEICGQDDAEVSSLDSLRAKFKVVS